MEKRLFRFTTDNEDLANWFDSQKEFASFAIETLNKVRLGELVPLSQLSETKELDTEYKKLRNKNLDLDIQLKEKKLSYMGIFHSEPSNAAIQAMSKGIEQRDFNKSEYENVNKYITVSQNQNYKWSVSCDICKEGETFDTRRDGILELIRHLTTEHTKKVMEMR